MSRNSNTKDDSVTDPFAAKKYEEFSQEYKSIGATEIKTPTLKKAEITPIAQKK